MAIMQNLTNALTGGNISDAVVANDMLASGKLGALTLTMATLEAATPELRQVFHEGLNQCLADHARVWAIAQDRGWYKAFASPGEQLKLETKMSEAAANQGR